MQIPHTSTAMQVMAVRLAAPAPPAGPEADCSAVNTWLAGQCLHMGERITQQMPIGRLPVVGALASISSQEAPGRCPTPVAIAAALQRRWCWRRGRLWRPGWRPEGQRSSTSSSSQARVRPAAAARPARFSSSYRPHRPGPTQSWPPCAALLLAAAVCSVLCGVQRTRLVSRGVRVRTAVHTAASCGAKRGGRQVQLCKLALLDVCRQLHRRGAAAGVGGSPQPPGRGRSAARAACSSRRGGGSRARGQSRLQPCRRRQPAAGFHAPAPAAAARHGGGVQPA